MKDEDGEHGPETVTVTVAAAPPQVVPQFSISEGQDLILEATGVNDIAAHQWDLDGDGDFTDAVGLPAVITWAQLAALNPPIVNDLDTMRPISVRALYTNGDVSASVGSLLAVTNEKPTATLLSDASGIVPEGTVINASFIDATDPSSEDAAGLEFSFDLKNDGIWTPRSSSPLAPPTTATRSGTQLIRGRVYDDDTFTEYVVAVSVSNVAPTLILDGADTVDEGAAYSLSLSANDPGDDQIERWIVNWGDGTVETYDGATVSTSHVYVDDGDYEIRVSAEDLDGVYFYEVAGGERFKRLSVKNVAPILVMAGAATSQEGSEYELVLERVADPGRDTLQYWSINWGDGSPIETVSAETLSVRHLYADDSATQTNGVYRISVEATDEDGTYSVSQIASLDQNITHFVDRSPAQVTSRSAESTSEFQQFVYLKNPALASFKLDFDGTTISIITADAADPNQPFGFAQQLLALSDIDAVEVSGAGTELDPWVVTYTADPASQPLGIERQLGVETSHYYLTTAATPRAVAARAADSMGGYLVTIDSASENEFVGGLIGANSASSDAVWIGLQSDPTMVFAADFDSFATRGFSSSSGFVFSPERAARWRSQPYATK